MAGLGQCGDLVGKILADAGQVGQISAALQHECNLGPETAHDTSGVPVGPDPEGVCLIELEEIGEIIERLRDIGIVNGHGRSTYQSERPRAFSAGRLHSDSGESDWPGGRPSSISAGATLVS